MPPIKCHSQYLVCLLPDLKHGIGIQVEKPLVGRSYSYQLHGFATLIYRICRVEKDCIPITSLNFLEDFQGTVECRMQFLHCFQCTELETEKSRAEGINAHSIYI